MLLTLSVALGDVAATSAGPIQVVDYESVTVSQAVGFGALASGSGIGTNYDDIIDVAGMKIGERFAGQTRSYYASPLNGDLDALSGSPTGPLSLLAGAPGENLTLFDVVDGMPPLGFSTRVAGNSFWKYPNEWGVAEGAVALLFDSDLPEFGLAVGGGNNGAATLTFYRRDGSYIDAIVLDRLTADLAFFGFRRAGGVSDIAGVTITNDDRGGADYSNFILGAAAPGPGPVPVPEPSTFALMGVGLLLSLYRASAVRNRGMQTA